MAMLTITALTENSPGVLHRITAMLTRRKINIESLTVSETERHGISRFTIVVDAEEELVEKIVKQIARIIEVRQAYLSRNRELIFKELAFFRVRAPGGEQRRTIEEMAGRYGAAVAYVDPMTVVVEKTGQEDDINSLYLLLEPYGIEEFIRSGRIALRKSGHPEEVQAALETRAKLERIGAF